MNKAFAGEQTSGRGRRGGRRDGGMLSVDTAPTIGIKRDRELGPSPYCDNEARTLRAVGIEIFRD